MGVVHGIEWEATLPDVPVVFYPIGMSANRSRAHDPVVWNGFKTVGLMIDHGVTVTASCEKCRSNWTLDLAKIQKVKGPFYTLVGRTIRCAKGHDAAMLAGVPGGATPRTLIHAAVAEDWTETNHLHHICPWCGRDDHGSKRFGSSDEAGDIF